MLTANHLSYYRSADDTRGHAMLGRFPLADIIAAHADEGDQSAVFVVVIAASDRAPFTLRAGGAAEALAWLVDLRRLAPRLALRLKAQSDPPSDAKVERRVGTTSSGRLNAAPGAAAAAAAVGPDPDLRGHELHTEAMHARRQARRRKAGARP